MSEPLPNPEAAQLAGLSVSGSHSMRAYFSSLRKYPRPAWNAMIACGITMVLGPAGILSATTTFFVAAVSKDFGWSQSQTLTLFSLPLLIVPFLLPWGGRWVDRWGVKPIAVPAVALYALTTAMTALVGANQLVLGAVLVISMGFGYLGSVVGVFKVMLAWFPEHRGIAFAAVGVVASLAAAVFSPLSELLIRTAGWRLTFVLLGLAILLVVFPAQVFLLSEPDSVRQARGVPAQGGGPDATPVRLPGVPLRAAVRTRAWIFIVVIFALAGGAVVSVSQNAVSLLGEHGYSAEIVSLGLSAQFMATVAGLILAGFILDRSNSPWLIMVFVASVLVALVIVASVYGSAPLLFLAMCLMGLVRGAESTVGPYLISRYFGHRAFGQIQGLTLAIGILAMGLIPIVVQTVAERTSSYSRPLLGLIFACAVAFVLAYFMPRYPAREAEPAAVPAPAVHPTPH